MDGCQLQNLIINFYIVGVCCVLGFIGNTVSFCFLVKAHFSQVTTFILRVLAIVDSMVLITTFIDTSLVMTLFPIYLGSQEYGLITSYYIKYGQPWSFAATATGMWITLLLAITHYITVCKPRLEARGFGILEKVYIQVTFVILVSCFVNIPRLFQYDIGTIESTDEHGNMLNTLWYKESWIGVHSTFGLIYNGVFYNLFIMILPMLFLIYLAIILVIQLRRSVRRRPSICFSHDYHTTILVIIIITIIIIFQLPATIYRFLIPFTHATKYICPHIYFYFECTTTLMYTLNSGCKLYLYTYYNKNFRQELKHVCCRKKVTHHNDHSIEMYEIEI